MGVDEIFGMPLDTHDPAVIEFDGLDGAIGGVAGDPKAVLSAAARQQFEFGLDALIVGLLVSLS